MDLNFRSDYKTSNSKCLRNSGLIPGVVYGKDLSSVSVVADKKELAQKYKLHKENKAFDIKLDDEIHKVYIQGVQRNPLNSNEILHFDLHKIGDDDYISSSIPIVLSNKSFLEGKGLIVQQQIKNIKVKYLPNDARTHINVDVMPLSKGKHIRLKDINIPENINVLEDINSIIASASYLKRNSSIEE